MTPRLFSQEPGPCQDEGRITDRANEATPERWLAQPAFQGIIKKRWAFRPGKDENQIEAARSGGSAPLECHAAGGFSSLPHRSEDPPLVSGDQECVLPPAAAPRELKGSKANSGNRTKAMRRIGSDFSSSFFSTVLMGTQLRVIEAQRQVRLQEYVACRVRPPSATFTVRRPSGILVKPAASSAADRWTAYNGWG